MGFYATINPADLVRMGSSWVRVRVIPKTLEMVLTATQPVLVKMSLSKGNALAMKRRSS